MLIVDRFEGSYAVIECGDGSFINLPAVELPAGVKEGDVLSIAVDSEATERRRASLQSRLNSLFKK
ncbi:DUF3006 domain-containing protein [Fusibacter sp. JL298sf-3]